MLKIDRANSNVFTMQDFYPDWLIYTDLSGMASGASGLIKMAFEVELPWIEDKMPRLKEVDVQRLSGIIKDDRNNIAEDGIGKRKERDED